MGGRGTEGNAYLVRGANLKCECGSHVRKLNLPKCHAVYITEQPMVHKLDSVPVINISSFGVCSSPAVAAMNPGPPPVVLKKVAYDEEGNPKDTGEDLGIVQGPACIPVIPGTWENTYNDTRVVDNGDKDPGDKLKDNDNQSKGYPACTTDSFLICVLGGIIKPITSGQVTE